MENKIPQKIKCVNQVSVDWRSGVRGSEGWSKVTYQPAAPGLPWAQEGSEVKQQLRPRLQQLRQALVEPLRGRQGSCGHKLIQELQQLLQEPRLRLQHLTHLRHSGGGSRLLASVSVATLRRESGGQRVLTLRR